MNKNEFLKVFGERARILRLTKRITQKELSQMAGVSAVTISLYEGKTQQKCHRRLQLPELHRRWAARWIICAALKKKKKTAQSGNSETV